MAPLLARRVARIAREGSPTVVTRALRREMWLRRERTRLRQALRSTRPLAVGPFVGEVGFELLYWRPFVRRLLRRFEVDPARVTVVGRGGSALWCREVAAHRRDVLDVLMPDELRKGLEERVARTGQQKQLDVDEFDREVIRRLGLADAALMHPLHLYWDARFVWEGLEEPTEALRHGDYDELEREPSLIEGLPLPERFVAVKAYASDCLPGDARTRAGVAALVTKLAARAPVVLLDSGFGLDDHEDLGAGVSGVVSIAGLLAGTTNLVAQAEVVARSDALVATYGGFSYLGPFLHVPTVAVASVLEWNPRHEAVLRAVRPAEPYVRARLGEAAEVVGRLLR